MAHSSGSDRKPRVLLVDDELDVVEALGSGLKSKGFEVTTFTNPVRALSEYVPGSYDAAVLDVRMEPFDGLELFRKLRGLDPRLAVLFLTAYADVIQDKPESIQFLKKPVSLRDLVSALEDIESSR